MQPPSIECVSEVQPLVMLSINQSINQFISRRSTEARATVRLCRIKEKCLETDLKCVNGWSSSTVQWKRVPSLGAATEKRRAAVSKLCGGTDRNFCVDDRSKRDWLYGLMTNSFMTNAVLIERAVSCWHLHQLISQTRQYLDSWLSDLEIEGGHVPQCPIAGDATACERLAQTKCGWCSGRWCCCVWYTEEKTVSVVWCTKRNDPLFNWCRCTNQSPITTL